MHRCAIVVVVVHEPPQWSSSTTLVGHPERLWLSPSPPSHACTRTHALFCFSLSLSLTLTLSPSLCPSLSPSLSASLTHTHTHSLTHSLTHTTESVCTKIISNASLRLYECVCIRLTREAAQSARVRNSPSRTHDPKKTIHWARPSMWSTGRCRAFVEANADITSSERCSRWRRMEYVHV